MKVKVLKSKFETTRDDFVIKGHIWKTPGDNKRKAVILSHGFMGNENMCHEYAKCLAEKDFVCFTYDFVGGGIHSRSTGKTREMSVLTEKKDLKQVIAYVKSQAFVDSDHISLLGLSQGGFVSALVAADIPNEIDRLLMFYPALCIPDDARKGNFMGMKFDTKDIPDLISKFPIALGGIYAKDVIKMDAYKEIQGFDGPVFLIHGNEDRIVNVDYSRKARNVYNNISYYEIPGADHGFRKENNIVAMRLLCSFMEKSFN